MNRPALPPTPVSIAPGGDRRSRIWRKPLSLGATLILRSLAAFIAWIFRLIKSSAPYRLALARAKSHPEVAEALGLPLREGLFTSGSMSMSGPSGRADLLIPLQGPKGRGLLHVHATRALGEWRLDSLVLETEHPSRRIDLSPRGLLPPRAAPGPALLRPPHERLR